MSGVFGGIWSLIWGVIKIPLSIIGVIVLLFVALCVANALVLYAKGKRPKKRTSKSKYKKRPVLARLLYDLPKRIVLDWYDNDPDTFPYQGMIIFTGRQGRGKTIGLVEHMRKMQQQYPECKSITNLAYTGENDVLKHWSQLTDYVNGKYGVIAAIDETQNWFSSAQSKNFPPEMLAVVTQNRKNRRVILGTAQSFYMLSKAIRTQTTEVRSCFTLFNCLTIVKRLEPILDFDGGVQELNTLGYYFFVHDKDLRESYDTYKVIETLSSSGFVPKDLTYV